MMLENMTIIGASSAIIGGVGILIANPRWPLDYFHVMAAVAVIGSLMVLGCAITALIRLN